MLKKRAGGSDSGRSGKRRMTGVQKGLILLALSILVLTGTVVAVYKSFVQPVEIKQPATIPVTVPADPETEEEIEYFVPPTIIRTETKVDEETGEETSVEVEVPASHKEGFYNILIVGTDEEGSRTDTIMIARMDVKSHTVALLSIPRDTLITGNYSVPKINSVYGAAGKGERGIQALKSKLAQLLGFEVDGYAIVNLDAFIELVDLVEGVEFDVPMNMDYDDPTQNLHIHLQAGVQHLNGEQAMGLVRFRKGYASQDIMRTQVQQQFLQALAKKCLSVVNLSKVDDMAQIFLENVSTDMTLGNLVYFGQELLKCDFDNMYTHTLQGEAVMVNDASCYALYLYKTLSVVNDYFNPYDVQITAANVSIRTPEQVRAEQALLEQEQEEEEQPNPEETLPEEDPEEEFDPEDWLWEEEPSEDLFPEEEPSEDLFPEESPSEDPFPEDDPLEEPFPEEEQPDPELPTDDWVEETPPAEEDLVI